MFKKRMPGCTLIKGAGFSFFVAIVSGLFLSVLSKSRALFLSVLSKSGVLFLSVLSKNSGLFLSVLSKKG